MRSNARLNVAEQSELEQKEAELSQVRSRHAAARSVLQQLLGGIAEFRKNCDPTLAWRLAELESIETETQRLDGYRKCYHSAGRRSQSEVKTLYRKVAKAVHPDLGVVRPETRSRHELMLKANRAYAEEDLRTLREILEGWRQEQGLAGEGEHEAELERMAALLRRERQELEETSARVEELRRSCAWRLKLRLDSGPVTGDLVSDMIAVTDLCIARALRRLALLKGGAWQEPQHPPPSKGRRLFFPDHVSCGTLYTRERSSVNYSQWKRFGEARGTVEFDLNKAVRLDLRGRAGAEVSFLRNFRGGDLQSLFLYDTDDAAIEAIVHLTGLEELYLSGARLTDHALRRVASLTGLKRIYIYQTAVTDQGLSYLYHLPNLSGLTLSGNRTTEAGVSEFQRALPRVRTVVFQWHR